MILFGVCYFLFRAYYFQTGASIIFGMRKLIGYYKYVMISGSLILFFICFHIIYGINNARFEGGSQ